MYYWSKSTEDITLYINHCEIFQHNKKPPSKKFGLLQQVIEVGKNFELLSLISSDVLIIKI